mmetsp:Transcript_40571/g.65542  ORF Transcript_40571/g.65542 Transcript_40571/m.65542 type:complete len:127 (-) Transcript_40571:42-422(-)
MATWKIRLSMIDRGLQESIRPVGVSMAKWSPQTVGRLDSNLNVRMSVAEFPNHLSTLCWDWAVASLCAPLGGGTGLSGLTARRLLAAKSLNSRVMLRAAEVDLVSSVETRSILPRGITVVQSRLRT